MKQPENIFTYTLRKVYWNLHSFTWDEYLETTNYAEEIEEIAQIAEANIETGCPALLDLGCATGSYSLALAKRKFNVTGIDYAVKMIRKAGRKALDADIQNISFTVSDFNKGLNFASSKFDFVLSAHTVIGAEDFSGILKEVRRVLKPDGIFFVVAKKPGSKKISPAKDTNIFLGLLLKATKLLCFLGHKRFYYDPETTQQIIESIGFKFYYKSETCNNNIILFKKTSI